MHIFRNDAVLHNVVLGFALIFSLNHVSAVNAQPMILADSFGQDLEYAFGGEEYISIATGYNLPVHEAPAIASVITADEIRARGATDLRTVLETIPGLHNTTSAISNTNEIYAIRGLHSKHNPHVLLLINGVPQTSMLFGNRGQAWGGMPVENIERVEVVRGPGSAVFGADAFAGTINIITKKANNQVNTEFGIRKGQYQTEDAWIIKPGKIGNMNISTYIQMHRTDGYDGEIDADAQTGFDTLNSTNASHAPGNVNYQAKRLDAAINAQTENLNMRASYMGRRDLGTGPGIAEAIDPEGSSRSDRWELAGDYTNKDLIDDTAVKISATIAEQNNQLLLTLYPPGAYGGAYPDGFIGNPSYWERSYRGEISAIHTGIKDHLIRFGAGGHYANQYRVEETKNFNPDGSPTGTLIDVTDTANVYTPEISRKVLYGFIQDEWEMKSDWKLTLGVRGDHYSDFGSTINPRAALVWSMSRETNLKILHGTAFRPPSFAELYNRANPLTLGNSNLKPEKVSTTEFGLDYHPNSSTSHTISTFHYEITDAIEFVQDGNGTTHTAQNVGKSVANGLEIESKFAVDSNITINFNYAYQKAIDNRTDSPIGFAPTHQSYFGVNWKVSSQWHAYPQLHSVIGRKRPSGDNRSSVADYHSLDMKLGYKPYQAVEIGIIATNLLDTDIREPSASTGDIPNDIPQRGRFVAVELRSDW